MQGDADSSERIRTQRSLAAEHLAKAMQINGRRGIEYLEHMIARAGPKTELGILLQKSRDLAIEKYFLNPNIEQSRDAGLIEVRKWMAQIQAQVKYDMQTYSPLSVPSQYHLRKPRVSTVEEFKPTATYIIEEATNRTRPASTLTKADAAKAISEIVRILEKLANQS